MDNKMIKRLANDPNVRQENGIQPIVPKCS